MNTYTTIDLGSACELIMGQSPSSDTYNTDRIGLPFFQGNADFGEEHPTPSTWCSKPKKKAMRGDILISVRAPIGAVNISTEECCIGRGVAAIRPDRSLLDSAFLRYYLIARRPELERLGTGSTFTAIGKKTLSKLEVRLYSLGDQLEMSRRLDVLSESIRTSHKQFTMLDNLVKSRFIEMFGDPNQTRTAGRIEDAFDIRDDLRRPLSSKERALMHSGMQYPYYGANGVVDRIDQFLTDCPAVCLAEDCGSYGAGESSAYIITGRAWVNNHAHLLVPKTVHALQYTQAYFQLLDINRFISGTTRPKLTQAQLRKIPFAFPEQFEREQFESFVVKIDKLRFDALRQHESVSAILTKCGEFPKLIKIKYAEIGRMNEIKSADFGGRGVQEKNLRQAPHMEKAIPRQHRPTC